VQDVVLIRHAYVRPENQGQGIGGALLRRLTAETAERILIGTWAAAEWAIGFYRKHGFREVGAIFEEAGIAHQEMRRTLNS